MKLNRGQKQIVLTLLIVFLFPLTSFGQIEIAGRLGAGHVGVFGSNDSDNGGNVGALLEVRIHPRLGVELEANKMIGLDARPVPCGLSVPEEVPFHAREVGRVKLNSVRPSVINFHANQQEDQRCSRVRA